MGRRRRCIKLEETPHEGILLYRRSLALLQLVDKIFHPRPDRTFDDDDRHVVPNESRGFSHRTTRAGTLCGLRCFE